MLRRLSETWLWRVLAAVLSLALLVGCDALLKPDVKTELTQLREGSYRLDLNHTALIFKIGHLGISTYVGRFNRMAATLEFDPDNLAATRLDAVVDLTSLDLNNPKLEERLGERSWFNVAEHPEARFDTLGVEVLDNNRFRFTGNLTLRGITRPLTLDATFHGGADNMLTGRYTLGFSATGSLRRLDFGMDKFPSLVGDEVQVEIYAEFQRR